MFFSTPYAGLRNLHPKSVWKISAGNFRMVENFENISKFPRNIWKNVPIYEEQKNVFLVWRYIWSVNILNSIFKKGFFHSNYELNQDLQISFSKKRTAFQLISWSLKIHQTFGWNFTVKFYPNMIFPIRICCFDIPKEKEKWKTIQKTVPLSFFSSRAWPQKLKGHRPREKSFRNFELFPASFYKKLPRFEISPWI